MAPYLLLSSTTLFQLQPKAAQLGPDLPFAQLPGELCSDLRQAITLALVRMEQPLQLALLRHSIARCEYFVPRSHDLFLFCWNAASTTAEFG